MLSTESSWSGPEKLIFKFIFCWVIIFIFSFSFPHQWLPDIGRYTAPAFEAVVKWFAGNVLQIKKQYTSKLISDSTGLYIHALLVAVYAVVITLVWTVLDKNKRSYTLLLNAFLVLIRYYLALQLFTYGFSKLFKWQFYLPEPNTLFTTMGEVPKDLLYWSAMGASRPYTMFAGIMEIAAALLLLTRRTFIAGALLALGIMVNVTVINFSFDISVKLYSLFLLLLCSILIAPFIKQLLRFFFQHVPATLKMSKVQFTGNKRKGYLLVKALVIGIVILDPLYPYIKENNFNDDAAPRPLLHGAYEVQYTIQNGDTLAALSTGDLNWRRLFIHRNGYLVTQYRDESMKDYELQYDTLNKYLVLTDYETAISYNLHYTVTGDSLMVLEGEWGEDALKVKLKKADLYKLPLMQREFNWTIDDR